MLPHSLKDSSAENVARLHKALFSLCFLLVALASSCNEEEFDNIPTHNSSDSDVTPEGLEKHSQSFTVSASSDSKKNIREVHMIWIIDNSKSMSEEVADVERGIQHFTDNLKKASSHLKVTMISRAKENTDEMGTFQGVSSTILESAGIHHVRHTVRSYDLLTTLASYLKPDTFKDYKFIVEQTKPIPSDTALPAHPSSDFFRKENALKVFLLVSDEPEIPCLKKDLGLPTTSRENYRDYRDRVKASTSEEIQPASGCFLDLLKDSSQNLSSYRFFAFIDRNYSSKLTKQRDIDWINDWKMSNEGYENLAKALGGQTQQISDITEEKWNVIFNEVASEIVSAVVQTKFTLKNSAHKVTKVLINDEVLDPKHYSFSGTNLLISSSQIKQSDKIEVSYLSVKK